MSAPRADQQVVRDIDDVCPMAINLARNCGYHVFPVRFVKRANGKVEKLPTIDRWPERASSDAREIAKLWAERPGDLIGIATGQRSNLDVLDLDKKHNTAIAWWRVNHDRLPPTRTFGTVSGGMHLHYLHRDGIKNTGSKICDGVDSRGQNGFAVYWFAYGCECIDQTPPQPMPDWLYDELTYVPPVPTPAQRAAYARNPDKAIDGLLRKLADAREGNRNGMLFWCACRLIADHGFGHNAATAHLLPIATGIGLPETEARKTIASAQGREPRGRNVA
jgi:hypothetical protein